MAEPQYIITKPVVQTVFMHEETQLIFVWDIKHVFEHPNPQTVFTENVHTAR